MSLSTLWILTYFVLASSLRDRCSPSPPHGRGGNAGTEKCTNLLSVTQLESDSAGVQSQTWGSDRAGAPDPTLLATNLHSAIIGKEGNTLLYC